MEASAETLIQTKIQAAPWTFMLHIRIGRISMQNKQITASQVFSVLLAIVIICTCFDRNLFLVWNTNIFFSVFALFCFMREKYPSNKVIKLLY